MVDQAVVSPKSSDCVFDKNQFGFSEKLAFAMSLAVTLVMWKNPDDRLLG